jgi:DNA-binding response OmpR family regulator
MSGAAKAKARTVTDALIEARAVAGGSSRPPPARSDVAPAPAVKTILVVDDDPGVRATLARALSTQYEVYQASDGAEAAELVARIPPPSLLVCDVVMPRLDGFTLAKVFKSHPLLRHVPIMFLTSRSSPQDMVKGIGLGARQYVLKPFNLSEVLAKIAKIVG